MLASPADVEKIQYPVFASPKLDGIRCSVYHNRALTRTLKDVPNHHVRGLLSDPIFEGFDGELIIGDPTDHDVYRNTVSGIMSKDGQPEFTYHVFDLHDEKGGWSHRYGALAGTFRPKFIQMLPHELVEHADDLLAYEAARVNEGYEGVILRKPDGHYKFGRSTAKEGLLMKLKRFEDSEAVVLEVIEEMHNGNVAQTNELGRTKRSSHKENKVGKGRMGALRVKDLHTGVEFELGTGFTDEDKAWWWEQRDAAMHPIAKYKSFPVGVKTKPRHPVFLGIRDERDL